MSNNAKTLLSMTLTGLLLLAFSGAVSARTIWVTGIVTKGPWVEKYRHIEVDDVKYTLMPKDVRIERTYETYSGSGMWAGGEISFRDIRVGQNIMIRVQGHRIYQIVIQE